MQYLLLLHNNSGYGERSSMLRLYPLFLSYVYVYSNILPIFILLEVSAFLWQWNTARPKRRYQESLNVASIHGLSLTDEPVMSRLQPLR